MRSAIISALNYFPGFKRALRGARNMLFPQNGVSSNYVQLHGVEVNTEGQRLRNSWRDSVLPQRQRALVEEQLSQYLSGARIDVFDVFVNSLRALSDLSPGATLLEVGCSSGFYSEVLKIAGLPINYTGCDYSEAFIRLAKEKYPAVDFMVSDATALDYGDSSFNIVVSGCCLLHIPEYIKGIEEAARVAQNYVIFHRTPVVFGQPEQWYRKKAYGVETVEIHFNEVNFLSLLVQNGLELINTYTLSQGGVQGFLNQGHATRTYVCRKKE